MNKSLGRFLPIDFLPRLSPFYLVFSLKDSVRWLPSSSALDPFEGLLVFQIWCECRPRFRDTTLAKKIDVRIIFFRLSRLQTLLLKNHIVRDVGPFPMSCHM